MEPLICPRCAAAIDRSQIPPRYPWTLTYIFRCQTCATMLRWDMVRKTSLASPWLFVFGVAASVAGLSSDAVVGMIALPVGLVALAVCIIAYCSAMPQLVVHSDE